MFIEEVMKKILMPISEKYLNALTYAKNVSAQDLYNELLDELSTSISFFNEDDSKMHGTTIFVSPGCSHNVRKGIHCGCSFCDWNESYLVNPAKAMVLREKSPELYKEIQYISLGKSRGYGNTPKIMEEFALHDCFDDNQVSADELNYIFKEKCIYSSPPIIGLVQVRADSITSEKISLWKTMVRKQLTLGIGVETGNEWIRNHWLNKNLTDATLVNAIKIAHENKCKVSLNLLLSLPGLTDKQCVEIFIESVEKLIKLGCDSIMISPLVRKKYTLQNILDNSKDVHINNFNSDWSMYMILEALFTIRNRKDLLEKLMFSSLNFNDYFNNKFDNSQKIISEIFEMLDIGAMKEYSKLFSKIEELRTTQPYKKYLVYYNSQVGMDQIIATLNKQSQIICTKLFDKDLSVQLLEQFTKELQLYEK